MENNARGSVASAPVDAPDTVLERLLDARFSCRGFQDREVEPEIIMRMLRLAQRGPSWCNTQPWELFITRGEGTRRLIGVMDAFARRNPPMPDLPFPERYAGVYLERRRACGWQLYESVGIQRGDRVASAEQAYKNFSLFGAPHVAIVTTERDLGLYGAVDCGVYLGNLLLAAQSLGVATIPQAALAAVAPAIREELDLPEHRQVLFGVSFGYADDAHPANGFRTTRTDVEDLVTWVT